MMHCVATTCRVPPAAAGTRCRPARSGLRQRLGGARPTVKPMISRQHECIFIHQRKCAGMAVIATFGLRPDNPDYHYMNDGVLSPEYVRRPADYFIFSVVRNPWDRFVSGWKYCASTRLRTLRNVLLDPPQTGHDYRHVTRPQVDILFDAQGQLATNFLIRHESIQHDFDTVCDRLAKPRVTLPRINVGSSLEYRSYFDDESLALFEQRFSRDIAAFGYCY